MRNIRAAVAAALVVAMMTGCGSTPAETGGSAPAAASQTGSDVSSAASGFEEDASPAQTPESTLPEDPSSAAGAESGAALSDDAIRPEFQQAMDSYEAFFDEYCDFMQRYSESDGTDLGMLADYADMMEQYAQVTSDFSNWNSDDLTTAELSLYLDVQTRVNQKLLELSA